MSAPAPPADLAALLVSPDDFELGRLVGRCAFAEVFEGRIGGAGVGAR
jgi:hypothetical protein